MNEIENEGAAAPDVATFDDELVQKTEEELVLEQHKELIDKARAKFGDIAIFSAPRGFSGIVILAAPQNSKLYDTFVNQLADDKIDKAVASRNFALSCTVHPDRDTLKKIFDKQPAFALKLVGRATELAGSEAKELGKG
jgi:hypothetical protein